MFGDAMPPAADQIQRVGIHDLQCAGLEREELRNRFADFLQMAEVDQWPST